MRKEILKKADEILKEGVQLPANFGEVGTSPRDDIEKFLEDTIEELIMAVGLKTGSVWYAEEDIRNALNNIDLDDIFGRVSYELEQMESGE